jgi:aminoglycoside 3-N-acetyltransferase
MHAVEEVAAPPYLFTAEEVVYEIVDDCGQRAIASHRRHAFDEYVQRYDRISGLLKEPAIREGSVYGSHTVVLEAQALWEAALAALKLDPFYFVDKTA